MQPHQLFLFLFLTLIALHLLVESWLSQRQITAVRRHRGTVPTRFAQVLTLESHQHAADYTAAKQRLIQLELGVSTLLLLGWTIGGGIDWLDRFWHPLFDSLLAQGVATILSFTVLSQIVELPLSLYRTFRLEQRFGFNHTTASLYLSDQIKQLLLLLLLGGGLSLAALWLMAQASPLWWLQLWALWISFSLLMLWAWPSVIAPLFNRFTPLEDTVLQSRIEALLTAAGFDCDGIFVMDGSKRSGHGNAYFTGVGKRRRIVFYDTLLESLEADQIIAVLAHELGHFHHHHIRQRLVLFGAITLLSLGLLGWLITQPWFYLGMGVSTPSNHTALLLFMVASSPFTFWINPLLAASSRHHEFEADAFAVHHGGAEPLIQALTTLYRENGATVTPDPLYSAYHDSHPPAAIRIDHLEKENA